MIAPVHCGKKPRTQRDKAAALCSRLILARPERVRELIGEHTAETFAKEHGVAVGMIRETFEDARLRARFHG